MAVVVDWTGGGGGSGSGDGDSGSGSDRGSRLFRRIKLQVFMDGVSLCTEVSVEGSCLRGIMLWCAAVCCALPGRVRAPCSVLRTRYYVCCAMYAVLCSLYSVVCTR